MLRALRQYFAGCDRCVPGSDSDEPSAAVPHRSAASIVRVPRGLLPASEQVIPLPDWKPRAAQFSDRPKAPGEALFGRKLSLSAFGCQCPENTRVMNLELDCERNLSGSLSQFAHTSHITW